MALNILMNLMVVSARLYLFSSAAIPNFHAFQCIRCMECTHYRTNTPFFKYVYNLIHYYDRLIAKQLSLALIFFSQIVVLMGAFRVKSYYVRLKSRMKEVNTIYWWNDSS